MTVGAKASKAASIGVKARKGMKFLGEIAGLLGMVADVGLSSLRGRHGALQGQSG